MVHGLRRDHRGTTALFYMDISLEETLRRHATRPQFTQFGGEQMIEWYRERDLLACGSEIVIGEDVSLPEAVRRIVSGVIVSASGYGCSGDG
jgi:hypothetical protein